MFALTGAALLALRRASASARHLVCLLTLSALLALPLFSLALPAWHLTGLTAARDAGPALAYQEPTPVRPLPALPVREGKELGQETHSGSAASSSVSSLTKKDPAKQVGGFFTQAKELTALYVLGLLLASARPLLGLWGITHLRRACAPITDEAALGVLADCAAALGMGRLPRLCWADVPVPMTWGWRRPVILLPLAPAGWPEDRLRSVLLHEMAHVKRRDWPGHRLACALYWFHPLVWLTARRLRAESEVACDDLVLSSGVPAADYARHLLDIARALPPASRPPQPAAIAMAQTPHIKRRILMILDTTQSRRTVTRRALLVALVPATAALVVLAVLRPDARAQNAPSVRTASTSVASSAVMSSHPALLSVEDLKVDGKSLLAGITDANKPGSPWWSASGSLLPTPIYNTNTYHAENHAGPNAHTVSFAFRLPADAIGDTVRYELPHSLQSSSDGSWVGKMRGDVGLTETQQFTHTGGTRVVTAEYPAGVFKDSVRVGIASGPWAIAEANQGEGQGTSSGSQTFIFSPVADTASGLVLTVTTGEVKDDVRVVAVDKKDRELLPTSIGDNSIGTISQITGHFDLPLSQLKEFRVETRPFQWIEYKDVALKPVQ